MGTTTARLLRPLLNRWLGGFSEESIEQLEKTSAQRDVHFDGANSVEPPAAPPDLLTAPPVMTTAPTMSPLQVVTERLRVLSQRAEDEPAGEMIAAFRTVCQEIQAEVDACLTRGESADDFYELLDKAEDGVEGLEAVQAVQAMEEKERLARRASAGVVLT